MSERSVKAAFDAAMVELQKDYARVMEENARIVAESKQCHEQNDRLVAQLMVAQAHIRELTEATR